MSRWAHGKEAKSRLTKANPNQYESPVEGKQEQIRLLEGVCDKIEGRLGGACVSINQLHYMDRLVAYRLRQSNLYIAQSRLLYIF